MSDHVHLLINLNPSVSLAALVKELKQSTSLWLKTEEEFKGFEAWNEGYYAASVGSESEEACINYIKSQEDHHGKKDFMQEIRDLAMSQKIEWDERDWA